MAKQSNTKASVYIPPVVLNRPAVPTAMDEIYLQQTYGGYIAPMVDPTPLPGVSTLPPATEYTPNRYTRNINTSDKPSTLADLMKVSNTPLDKGMGGSAYTEADYIGSERYKYVIPGTDNEDANARVQPWYSTMINGVTKGLVLTGTTFLQTTVGAVNGLAQWANTGKFTSFYDNELNRKLDEVNQWFETNMPSYETKDFREAAWYSPDYLFTGNFLWEGIVKNLGFAAGAALSGMAFGSVMKGLAASSRAMAGANSAERAILAAEEALAQGESAVGVYGRIASFTKEFGGYENILDKGFRATVAGLSTTGEAAIEAYHNLNDFRQNAIDIYTKENGHPPAGEDLEKINAAAEGIGNASFKANVGLLSITNYIQFPTILGRTFKADKAIRNEFAPAISQIEKEAGKYVVKPASTLTRVGRAIKNPYIFAYSEAIEEGSQFAITKGTEDYYNKKYINDEGFTNPVDEALKSVFAGVKETLTTDEGMKNILIGGLSGALMLGPGRFGQSVNRRVNTGKAIKEFGTSDISNFLKDTQDSVQRGQTLEKEYLDFIDNDDKLGANESEHDYVLNYLMPRIKYGRHDMVLADIKDMRQLAMSEGGFQQLKDEGKVKQEDTVEDFLKRLDNLEATSIAVAQVYADINLKYRGKKYENGERIYNDEVIDKLVYAGSKIKYYNTEIPKLMSELSVLGTDLTAVLAGDEKALEAAQLAAIDNQDLNDDEVEDLVEKLNRVAVMNQYKKRMLKEYAEIKAKPEEFTSKKLKDEELDSEGKPKGSDTLLIKTKKFPKGKNYTVGKKYVLGNVFDEDKKGNKIFRFPTLTFLGENADGTIKIQDNKGVIRDVKRDVFEDYNLGTEESLNKSPDAKFLYEKGEDGVRNINRIVYWNTGKKKAGDIKGRLKWDPDNDNLVFVYKSGKKTKEKVINIDAFEAKKGYNKGIFHFGRALTAAEQGYQQEARQTGRTAAKIKARQEQRAEILTELYVEVSERHEATEKLIESKKQKIDKIKQELAALKGEISEKPEIDKRAKNIVKFKKATREAMSYTLELTRMIDELEREVEMLEDQNESTDETLAYIEELLSSLDSLPDNTKEFLKELENEITVLQELSIETNDQIVSIKSLIKSAQDALDSVVKYVSNLIASFEAKYPNVPRFMGQGFVDFLKENPNFLKLKPNYREDLKIIDEEISFLEEADIAYNENRIADLEKNVNQLENDMRELELKARGVQTVINKFKQVHDNYIAEKKTKESIKLNKKLHEEIIGTLDPTEPSHRGGDGYEADPKKGAVQVAASTTVSTDFKEPHVLRANRFAFRFKKLKNKDKIKAVMITANNEKHLVPGLVEFVRAEAEKNNRKMDPAKAIFAVFVQVDAKGKYELVDENGKKLTDKQKENLFDHVIFQPFPLENLEAMYKKADGRKAYESMFRKEVPEKTVTSIKEQYKKWRDGILAETDIRAPKAMSPSFGQPIYEQKWITNPNGSEVQVDDKEARNTVAQAGLIDEVDLEKTNVLNVPTKNETVYNNGVTYKTPKGRVFLNILEGLIPMNANKLSKKKADVIYKVLKKLTMDLATEGSMTDESQRLFKWLRTVIQWGSPKEGKKPGHSSMWFDYAWNEADQEYEPRLFISRLGYSIPFDVFSIEENETEIKAVLQEFYHNVKSKNETNFNDPYPEIIDIRDDGSIVTKVWRNYQTYLLSGADGRSIDDIPLTTPYKALKEDGDVNRNGIYFTFDDAEEMFTVETPEPVKQQTTETTTEEKPAPAPTVEGGLKTTIPVFDNTTDNTFVLKNGKAHAIYRVNGKGEITSFQMFDSEDLFSHIMKVEATNGGTKEDQLKQVEIFKADVKNKILENIVIPAWEQMMEPTTDEAMDDLEDFDDPLADSADDALDADDIEMYRIQTEEDPYETTENWSRVEKWMLRNLPNIPFFRVQNLIRATKNRKALGMFHKAAIYVYENAEFGTAYHEAFEGVWKMFTDSGERNDMIKEFRARKGVFVERETKKTIPYADATFAQAKEEMAEEFRRYMVKREGWQGTKIGRFFRQLLDYIEQFLNWLAGEPSKIDNFYRAIDRGAYKSFSVEAHKLQQAIGEVGIVDIENAEGDETSEFSIISRITVPTRELNDIMQHMTFSTIASLMKSDGSLMDSNNYNKAELYFALKEELKKRFKARRREQNDSIDKYKKLKDQAKVQQYQIERGNTTKLWMEVEKSWDAIVDRHIENLQTYNIIFDENDYVLLNDEDNSGREDYIDGRKIDPFKKSSAAVKLLLASIPVRDPITDKAKKSSINGVLTMDVGEAYLQLMEELSSARNIDDMLMRLNKLASHYSNYKTLYERLTGEKIEQSVSETGRVMPPSFKNLTKSKFELVSSFWRTFKKQKPDIITVHVLENGKTVVTDTSLTSAAKSAQFSLRNNIVNAIKSNRADGLFILNKGKFTAINANNKGFAAVSLDPTNPETYSAFLNKLGITEFNPGVIKALSNNERKVFYDRVEGIKNELRKMEDVSNLANTTLNIEQDLFSLGVIKATIENEEFQSTYFNVNGEMAQTFIGPNALSNLYHTLTQIDRLEDLMDTEFDYLITDNFSRNSLLMKLLFASDGTRIPGSEDILKPVFIDGTIDEKNNVKKDSSRLTYLQRIVQEINANLDGVYLNLVPGDASIEWALRLHTANSPFVSIDTIENGEYLKIFKDYLIDELNLIREGRTTANPKNSKKFRFFEDILPADLKANLLSKKGDMAQIVYSKEFEGKINIAIKQYVSARAKEDIALLNSYGLIKRNDDKQVNVARVNLPENMSESSFNSRMEALAANYMIANIELHKVIYGDPFHYSDELKRIKSFSSPRQALIHGSNTLNTALDALYNAGYEKGTAGWSDMFSPNLKAVTLADVWSINEYLGKLDKILEGYLKPYEETDGGGLTTIKGKRKIMLRAGTWNEKLEAQYRFDIAYEDFYRGRQLTDEQLKIFDPSDPDRLNPGVQDLYTPIKPIVSGRKGNGRYYNDTLLDKFALLPMSFRLAHKISPNSNILALYNKMQDEDVDYAVFSSGRKVGGEAVFSPYKNGKINTDPFQTQEQMDNPSLPQTVLNVPFSIISIQTDVPTKEDDGTTQGSQITKLSTLDYMEAGIPIDYKIYDKKGKEITDLDERYASWLSITEGIQNFEEAEDKRAEHSELYKEIVNNRRLLNAKVNIGYRRLLASLGITEENGELKITKRDRMASTLRDEIFRRAVNDNISASFQGFLNGDAVLEGTPLYKQIRNVLFSIARKNIVRPKINGGFKVQMFNTFFEDNRIETTKDGKGNDVYTSGDLKFYVDENGKRVCEIMVARWFDSPLSDEEIIDKMYEKDDDGNRTETLSKFGESVLQGVGYRIPTQKQNSIDAFRIKKLLPKEMKDTVIVPVDLVKKVGSDFDIDKLSVYLKNVIGGRNIRALEFMTDENSTVDERYVEWVADVAGIDSQKYFRFLASDEIIALKKQFKQEKESSLEKYEETKVEEKAEFKQQFEILFSKKEDAKTDQHALIKSLFDDGKKDFWSLSKSVLNHFHDLKASMAFKGTQGPIEIQNYMALAISLKNDRKTSAQDKLRLLKVIANYERILLALGQSKEEINAIQKQINEVKAEKTETIEELMLEIQRINDENYANYLDARKEINLEWAKNVANVESLYTLDEFKELSIYDQNPSKNLDNAYIDSLFNLTTHEQNFKRLVVPNSADEAKKLSNEIMQLQGIPAIDYSKPANMLSRGFMSGLRHAFVSGKYAIGISAVAQTNHSQNQRTGIVLNEENLAYLSAYDAQFLTDTKVNFRHVNKLNGRVTLSGILSANKSAYISDIIGMFIDGYVDISKGPWIMSLGATANVAGTWLFLLKVGVPLRDVAYFMNQPIIKDYLKQLENMDRTGIFSKPAVEYMYSLYSSNAKMDIAMIPQTSMLKSMIGKSYDSLGEEQKAYQTYILKEFLKYGKMSEQLLTYVQGSNFDTANFNDPLLVYKKEIQLEMAKRSIISSVEDNLEASFVGGILTNVSNARDGYSDILVSDSVNKNSNLPGPRDVVQAILRPYVSPYINDKTFVRLGRRVVENLFDWAMQTGSLLNQRIAETFFDTTDSISVVKQMMKFKETVMRNETHPMYNNIILKNLLLDPSGRAGQVDNLYIKAKSNKAFDENLIINSFRELREYLESKNSDLFDKFMRLAILQSGLTNSYLSFNNLIPYEEFIKYYNNYISMLPSNPTIRDFYDLDEFQRTNPTDRDIVPVLKAKDGTVVLNNDWDFWGPTVKYWNTAVTFMNKNLQEAMDLAEETRIQKGLDYHLFPKLINVGLNSMYGASDILSWYWEDLPITEEDKRKGIKTPWAKKQDMMKRGDYSFRKKGLFKKVYREPGVPLIQTSEPKKDKKTGEIKVYESFVYKLINTRGHGARVQEHYGKKIASDSPEILGERSIIDNDFANVVEASDKRIVDIFDNGVIKKQVAKPQQQTQTEAPKKSSYPVSNKNIVKEIKELNAKYFGKSGRLQLGNKVFDAGVVQSKEFAQKLLSLGYTQEQVGAILKLIC